MNATPYMQLIRWRDVGDGPIGYTAGNDEFRDDVVALLKERDALLDALSSAQPVVSDRAAGGRPLVSVSRANSVLNKITSVVTKAAGAKP